MSAPFEPPDGGTVRPDPFAAPPAPSLPALPSLPTDRGGGVAAPPPLPSAPPEPPAFDARRMVESQRVKVAEPSYGVLPGSDGTVNQQAIDAARERMLKTRRKNDRFVRAVLGAIAVVVVLAGIGMYFLFQSGEESESDETVPPTTTVAATPGEVTADGGVLGAIDDARDAVAEINGSSSSVAP